MSERERGRASAHGNTEMYKMQFCEVEFKYTSLFFECSMRLLAGQSEGHDSGFELRFSSFVGIASSACCV